ncbi:DUF423 domain-containing protein [Aliikangiella marina]|uniref:DUF423 domain-containing protein n=1 Tax=Aliikangiella marina TaxID=1712262 RepID=A0A545T937_9GAMM|nr:DUF423 domain-containing protein [Aliikangiella marina]TQV73719.1 DUF423 domain-containing protein [Aliikangiella marina]
MSSHELSLTNRWVLVAGTVFGLLSVIIGAFAAHSLKGALSSYSIGIFETAARYQMYHALALCCCGLILQKANLPLGAIKLLKLTALSFIVGILLFSGSLYLLAVTSIKWLGMITPIGGLGLIIGWLLMMISILKA